MNKICPLWNGEKGLQLCHGSILNHSVQYSRKHKIFTKPDFLLLAWASYISFFYVRSLFIQGPQCTLYHKTKHKEVLKKLIGLYFIQRSLWHVIGMHLIKCLIFGQMCRRRTFMISTYITLTNLSTCWLKKLRNRTYAVKHESSPVTTDSVGFWTGVIILINCGWTGVDSTTFGLTVCGCNGVDVNDPVLTWELRLIF